MRKRNSPSHQHGIPVVLESGWTCWLVGWSSIVIKTWATDSSNLFDLRPSLSRSASIFPRFIADLNYQEHGVYAFPCADLLVARSCSTHTILCFPPLPRILMELETINELRNPCVNFPWFLIIFFIIILIILLGYLKFAIAVYHVSIYKRSQFQFVQKVVLYFEELFFSWNIQALAEQILNAWNVKV